MVRQMERVQKEENRTRSELLREAWRQYFEARSVQPTRSELAAIRKGRAEIKNGKFVNFDRLLHRLDTPRCQKGRKNARKGSS